jgi:hypothetical protein
LNHPDSLPPERKRDAFYPEGRTRGPIIGIGVCGGDITVHAAELRVMDKDGRPAAAPARPAAPAPVVAK